MIYLVKNTSGGLELNLTFNLNCYFPREREISQRRSRAEAIETRRFLRLAGRDRSSRAAEEPLEQARAEDRASQRDVGQKKKNSRFQVDTEPVPGQTIGRRCIYTPIPAGRERSRQRPKAAESQVEDWIEGGRLSCLCVRAAQLSLLIYIPVKFALKKKKTHFFYSVRRGSTCGFLHGGFFAADKLFQ